MGTGGAGEGVQWLKPEGTVHNKQEVKTDRFLPAYCDPPNPCPIGLTAADGCDPSPTQKFTADFSKLYQASQECHCDREHNYGCSNSPMNHNNNNNNKSSPKERESLLKNNLKDLARMFAKEEEEEEMGAREDKKAGSGRGESNHVKDNNNDNEKTGSKFT